MLGGNCGALPNYLSWFMLEFPFDRDLRHTTRERLCTYIYIYGEIALFGCYSYSLSLVACVAYISECRDLHARNKERSRPEVDT